MPCARKRTALLWLLAVWLSGALPYGAKAADTRPAGLQFQDAYLMLLKADNLREQGQVTDALELYQQTLAEYAGLSSRFPDWQPGVTRFRTAYCRDQLDALMKQLVHSKAAGSVATAPAPEHSPPSTGAPQRPTLRTGADDDSDIDQAATRKLAEGAFDDAADILLQAVRQRPDDPRIRLLLGMTRCAQSRYLDALFILEPLVEEMPDHAAARLALASAYLGLGQIDAAAQELDRAVVLAPEQPEPHYNMAQLLLLRDPPEFERARQHYERSLELGGARDPDFAARLPAIGEDRDKGTGEQPGGLRRLFPFRLFGSRPEDPGTPDPSP